MKALMDLKEMELVPVAMSNCVNGDSWNNNWGVYDAGSATRGNHSKGSHRKGTNVTDGQ